MIGNKFLFSMGFVGKKEICCQSKKTNFYLIVIHSVQLKYATNLGKQ